MDAACFDPACTAWLLMSARSIVHRQRLRQEVRGDRNDKRQEHRLVVKKALVLSAVHVVSGRRAQEVQRCGRRVAASFQESVELEYAAGRGKKARDRTFGRGPARRSLSLPPALKAAHLKISRRAYPRPIPCLECSEQQAAVHKAVYCDAFACAHPSLLAPTHRRRSSDSRPPYTKILRKAMPFSMAHMRSVNALCSLRLVQKTKRCVAIVEETRQHTASLHAALWPTRRQSSTHRLSAARRACAEARGGPTYI